MRQRISNFLKRLTYKYQLLIINKDTLEERISLSLNKLNVFLVMGMLILLLISGTILLISYTSLKEYIPKEVSSTTKRRTINLVLKVDSLERELQINKNYITLVRDVLTGKISYKDISKDSLKAISKENNNPHNKIVKLNREDSLLRKEVALEDKFNILNPSFKSFVFRSPVKGIISSEFDIVNNHYGIDISATRHTPVKAIAAGVIIFEEWTVETGYVVIISHNNNIISIYKHNEFVYKKQGDYINAGEVIATVGNTGEYSFGYHLHFEIWADGFAINPRDLVTFD